MQVVEVIEELRLGRTNAQGQVYARCPLHADRKPSFSINAESGLWTCHAGCGSGNLLTLLRRLGRNDLLDVLDHAPGARKPYIRTTDRTSGGIDDICSQLRYGDWFLRQGYRHEEVKRILASHYEISASTAHERVMWLTGKRWVWRDERGVLQGRRVAFCLRKVREQSKEHRVALRSDKSYWRTRFQTVRAYIRISPEGKYETKEREDRIVSSHELAEEAMASLCIPRPPPEIARWTPNELRRLTIEASRKLRAGEAFSGPWADDPQPTLLAA